MAWMRDVTLQDLSGHTVLVTRFAHLSTHSLVNYQHPYPLLLSTFKPAFKKDELTVRPCM